MAIQGPSSPNTAEETLPKEPSARYICRVTWACGLRLQWQGSALQLQQPHFNHSTSRYFASDFGGGLVDSGTVNSADLLSVEELGPAWRCRVSAVP